MDEQTLIERARAGDPAAERALYDTHVDRVYRLTYRLVGEDALAQDLTQDTFIRAFERLREFRGDSALSTWLHTIATSVALNALKKVRRLHTREAPLHDEAVGGAAASAGDFDLRDRLAAAVDALPTGYRTVFVMHDVEGYTHEEIGAALGITSGGSKAQLSRARSKLRAMLGHFAKEGSR